MSVFLSSPDMAEQVRREKHSQSFMESYDEAHTLGDERYSPRIASSKPHYHVTAPNGWMNDPCGLGYDPDTGIYHLFFQWNPYGNDWGNMSWGHSTSTDLVSWTTLQTPALTPSAEYDKCGVFTGCLRPTGIHGKPGALTAIYTSVSHLPIHFTLPYTRGSESLSLALSEDGGRTWERQNCNPLLSGPPQHLSVTGWRDPCITTWDRQDRQRQGVSQIDTTSQQYGFVSGGIVGENPTVFVYSVNPEDLRQWKYVGLLVNVGLNFCPSRWSGDYGVNWEVANFTTLLDDFGETRDFIIMGAEGCLPGRKADASRRRDPRGQLWMSVKSSGENVNSNQALATYAFGGIFDHGCLYAANSFWDSQSSQRIVYGWITEEDLPDSPRYRQGWSGMVSLPRVVNLMTLRNVKKARSSPLKSITSLEVVPGSPGRSTFTIHTLGISPDSRVSRLRNRAKGSQLSDVPLSARSVSSAEYHLPLRTARWELRTEFSIGDSCQRVAIEIAHNSDFKRLTTLAWDPFSETFTIHRPPVEDPKINHDHESAPHTLFTFADDKGNETEETLQVHAFFDKSVLEVFVNGRTVISTRIYHPSDRCYGIRFFAETVDRSQPGEKPTTLLQANCWDGLEVN
ncbi:uncharacterized protein N7459_009751 [Penicillium hispanicum]|uniref:uncharacterized protein n=1 Tax=Penicillium hispanicum TaxID=1080232 RepID=UPI0025411930|nr:uncharacterized protein N7459_009751 [Penicillium hispanicum]KAJ5570321.1 hypothetical protein N7459_009751 [Penicillium hispanicum]